MDTFTVLADPTRRSIVELLAHRGRLSTGDISANFSVSQPAISQHLKVLRDSQFLVMEKRAQSHLYALNQKKLQELEEWAQRMTRVWNARFDRLEHIIEQEKRTSTHTKG